MLLEFNCIIAVRKLHPSKLAVIGRKESGVRSQESEEEKHIQANSFHQQPTTNNRQLIKIYNLKPELQFHPWVDR